MVERISRVDYKDGKIYKLFIRDQEDYPYIGSTCDTLIGRMYDHRYQATNEKVNKCASAAMFAEGNDVQIELLEAFPCTTKDELRAREQYWFEQFPTAINTYAPKRDWKARWAINGAELNAKHLERSKQRMACPTCGADVRRGDLSRHRKQKHPQE
jgi:hypothetical protein